MSEKTELAKAAAAVIAPELVIPAELVEKVARGTRRSHQDASGVVVAPPQPFHVFRKARLRVYHRGDAKVVVYEPASGLTAKEVAELVALGALLAGLAYGAQQLQQQQQAIQSNPLVKGLSWISGGKL